MSLTSDIKEYGLEIGYDRVGFTTAEKFTSYEQDLKERREMYSWAIDGRRQLLKAADPQCGLPGAQSIIVTTYDFLKQEFPRELVGKVGRVHLAYGPFSCNPLREARYQLMRKFLEGAGLKLADRGLLPPVRLAGARAGIADIGRNTFSFAGGAGSFILLEVFVVDKALEYGTPDERINCPDGCTACIDACPTAALYAPFKVNPLKCIAYNTFASPDSINNPGHEIIPADIRENMGTWVYGCDVCQQVCPRNQPKLKAKLPPNAYLNHISCEFSLDRLLDLSDDNFARVSRLLTYIKKKSYFQRNAAVAIGNLKDESFTTLLGKVMMDSAAVVRAHAAWALGKIGGVKARNLLENSLSRETSESVHLEIVAALNR